MYILKNKNFVFLLYLIIGLLIDGFAIAAESQRGANNYSRRLLTVMRWDERYEQERKADVEYLLGNINGDIVKGLTAAQKDQVLASMRNAVYKKMLDEKNNFRNYLLIQYNQFFTMDELQVLLAYYSTDMMQMIIKAQLDQKQLTIEDIKKTIDYAKPVDQKAIKNFDDSYLRTRNARFQEKANKLLNDLIYKKLKEIIDLAYSKLPETIELVKSQSYTK